MFYYTTQGNYIKKNIEGFTDTNNSASSCDDRVKQISSEYDIKINEQKSAIEKSIKEKEECAKQIAEINKQFQIDKTNFDLNIKQLTADKTNFETTIKQLTADKTNFESTINQLTADKQDLIKKIDGQKSCDTLIKQSYSDFEKQYQTQKDTYESRVKEQKEITEKTMKQFLIEKEAWEKNLESQKIELSNSLKQEKDKLETTKKLFEEKIKKLGTAIVEITSDINKI